MKKPFLALGIFILFSISNVMATGTDDFVTIWEPFSLGGYTIKLPMIGGPYSVDWNNDGIWDDTGTGTLTYTYWNAGPHTVRVSGNYTSFSTQGDVENAAELSAVIQWGTQSWTTMRYAFNNAVNLINTASDIPNFSSVTDMYGMFSGATLVNPDVSNWDTSKVTDMNSMFDGATSANPDVSGWDVSSLADASNMFTGATSFTTANYDKLLIGWAGQTLINGIRLDVGSTTYCSADAVNALAIILGTYSWDIYDGGMCPSTTTPEIIPAMPVWGLGILAGLLSLIGFVRRRKA